MKLGSRGGWEKKQGNTQRLKKEKKKEKEGRKEADVTRKK